MNSKIFGTVTLVCMLPLVLIGAITFLVWKGLQLGWVFTEEKMDEVSRSW